MSDQPAFVVGSTDEGTTVRDLEVRTFLLPHKKASRNDGTLSWLSPDMEIEYEMHFERKERRRNKTRQL